MTKVHPKCPMCGQEFAGYGNQITCSRECGYAYASILPRKKRKCYNCKVPYLPSYTGRYTQKYCSPRCSAEFHAKKREPTAFFIFRRDNFKCIYCGKSSIEDGVKLHVDHLIARKLGGGNEDKNLVTSCKPCNLSKSARVLSADTIYRIQKKISLNANGEADFPPSDKN